MSCIGQPVSWLTLEHYHLDELSAAEARRVAVHLEACPACAACARSIEEDARSLPVLPSLEPSARPRWFTWPRIAMVAGAGLAALLVVLLVRTSVTDRGEPPMDRVDYKGGEAALILVREREGAVVENPDRYLTGDRFRLLVTVPGTKPLEWDVAIFHSGKVFFPYERGGAIGPLA